jgi:DNA-binding IscR family transcriptional regulator
VTVTACSEDDHGCDQYSKCSIRDPLWKIKNRILDALTTMTMAEMAVDEPIAEAVAEAAVSRLVFVPHAE